MTTIPLNRDESIHYENGHVVVKTKPRFRVNFVQYDTPEVRVVLSALNDKARIIIDIENSAFGIHSNFIRL